MKNSKKVAIIAIIVMIIALMGTVGYALFTSTQEDTAQIKIGNIDVILEEDWPDDVPEIGIERNEKNVWGRSVADKKAYVRMRFIPVVEYYWEPAVGEEGTAEWRTAPISQDNIGITITNNENWVRQGEYYYYKKILDPGESTDKLNLKWDIYEIPSSMAKYEKVRTDVRVLLEYSQISNDIWKDTFQIENLPDEVER